MREDSSQLPKYRDPSGKEDRNFIWWGNIVFFWRTWVQVSSVWCRASCGTCGNTWHSHIHSPLLCYRNHTDYFKSFSSIFPLPLFLVLENGQVSTTKEYVKPSNLARKKGINSAYLQTQTMCLVSMRQHDIQLLMWPNVFSVNEHY